MHRKPKGVVADESSVERWSGGYWRSATVGIVVPFDRRKQPRHSNASSKPNREVQLLLGNYSNYSASVGDRRRRKLPDATQYWGRPKILERTPGLSSQAEIRATSINRIRSPQRSSGTGQVPPLLLRASRQAYLHFHLELSRLRSCMEVESVRPTAKAATPHKIHLRVTCQIAESLCQSTYYAARLRGSPIWCCRRAR